MILRLLAHPLSEEDLLEIRRIISRYLFEKLTREVDRVVEEKGWTQEDFDRMLLTHYRTPYNPLN